MGRCWRESVLLAGSVLNPALKSARGGGLRSSARATDQLIANMEWELTMASGHLIQCSSFLTPRSQVDISRGIDQSIFTVERIIKIHSLDSLVGPIVAPEFELTAPHFVATRVLEQGVPSRVGID